jgi:hypothetical protein
MIGNCPIRRPRRGSNKFRNNISNNDHPSEPSAHLVAPNKYCLMHLSRLFLIGLGAQVCTPWICVQISDFKVRALLDSGSTCSVTPSSLYNRLRQRRKVPPLKKFPARCLTATSQPLSVVGQIRCKLRVGRALSRFR